MYLLSAALGRQGSEVNVYKSDLSSLRWKILDTQEMRAARQPSPRPLLSHSFELEMILFALEMFWLC